MSQKMKIFKVFLLLCTLSLFNCQPEQEVTYKEETTSRKLNIWKYPAERIFQDSKVVKEKITSLKQKNIEARLTSSIYNFSIEESEVQVIYEDNYTQYSFLVYRDNPIPNLLENYICKVYHDGFIEQFLVSYPYTQDENGMVYDTQNATMQVIQDNSLNYATTSRIPAGCVPEFLDTAWTYECVNVACSGPGSGSHIEPSDCLCGTPGHEDCTPPHTECNWMSVNIWTYSCPNNGGSGDTTGDTGVIGGGSTGTTTTEEEIITVPVNMIKINPCEKLKNLFNQPQPNIKNTILNDLRPNIAINPYGEIAATLQKTSSGNMLTSILPPTSTNSIGIPAGAYYYSAIHTHPLDTYPMFSWSDVYTLYELNKNLIPSNEGLASFLLVCKDDFGVFQTYAIVFNQETLNSLELLFNSPSFVGLSPVDIAREKDLDLKAKYDFEFNNGTFNYEKAFLEQFANTNISLYKANSTIDNWSRIQINQQTQNIIETPCN